MRGVTHAQEVAAGNRFTFGKNWRRFIDSVNNDSIRAAENALIAMLGDVYGKSFLDVGCGSGLSSLAAHRLGALVRSFDYDPQSVACTLELQRRYGLQWVTEEGSALDTQYLASLGQFDIVYSWGVLHHTGQMSQALENMVSLVKPGGVLFVAIYNDQGWKSRVWYAIKRAYNRSAIARAIMLSTYAPTVTAARLLVRALRGRVKLERGMGIWHDEVDWLGGYPFEVAAPKQIVTLYGKRGLTLARMVTVGGKMGCNEFVFLCPASHS